MTERSWADISDNAKALRERIARAAESCGRSPAEIRLMAVTKTVPAELVNAAIDIGGVRLLGENRAQELLAKYGDYHREGVEIHFIGHLQTNKVRQVIDKVSMIESVDSIKLAAEIGRQAQALRKVMDVLIEVNICGEASKSGVPPQEAGEFARALAEVPGIRVRGLMAIPPPSVDILQNERNFFRVQQLSVDMKAENIDNISMDILSMGMSGDFESAIKYGANIVRLGSALFGERAG